MIAQISEAQQSRWLTVFIHGTLPPWPLMGIPVIYHFFYCPEGITRADQLNEKFHLAQIAQTLSSYGSPLFTLDQFYLFGWSGSLSFVERKKAARLLSHQLLKLIAFYQKTHETTPAIRLIAHSHGGNVALNLARYQAGSKALEIDELILLACPVQKETSRFINSSMFKKIYSIHSHRDLLQVIDPQAVHGFVHTLHKYGLAFASEHLDALGPLFSERHFQTKRDIIQINATFGGRPLFHIEFLMPDFFKVLPALLKKLPADTIITCYDKRRCDAQLDLLDFA